MSSSLNYDLDDNKKLIAIISNLSVLRSLLRKFVPEFNIEAQDSKDILILFEKVANDLLPILNKLGIIDIASNEIKTPSNKIKSKKILEIAPDIEEDAVIETGTELLSMTENKYILISSNTAKKKLKGLGVAPNYIISTSGPLYIKDYEKLGKKLPEKALKGIKIKNDKLKLNLKELTEAGEKIVYIYATDDITDNLNLARVQNLENELGIEKIKIIKIESWNLF